MGSKRGRCRTHAYANFLKIMNGDTKCKKRVAIDDIEMNKQLKELWDCLDSTEKAIYEEPMYKDEGYNGKPLTITTLCNPKEFIHTVKALSVEKEAAVVEMGFGSLLHMHCSRLSRPLCQMMVEHFDPVNGTVLIHGRTFYVSHIDFERVMGLKNGGCDIDLMGDTDDMRMTELRNLLSGEDKEIRKEHLKKILIETNVIDDTFKICFALYSLATVLIPSSTGIVNPNLLLSLIDTATISEKNWSKFCFNHLVNGIKGFQNNSVSHMPGCLIFLQLLYCDVVSYSCKLVDKYIIPIAAWGPKQTKRLNDWVIENGGFDSKLVIVSKDFIAKKGEDADISSIVKQHLNDELASVKADVGTLVRETVDKIVGEVLKSLKSSSQLKLPTEHLVHEVNGQKVIVIESEGGNDTEVPSDLPPLVSVGQRKRAAVGKPPVELQNDEVISANPNARQQKPDGSNCSRSPADPVGKNHGVNATGVKEGRSHARCLFEPHSGVHTSGNTNQLKTKKQKASKRRYQVGPFNTVNEMSKLDEDLLRFCFFGRELTGEEKRVPVATYDGETITRGDLACLEPQTFLVDDVINIMADYMCGENNSSWFLRTFFGQRARDYNYMVPLGVYNRNTRRLCRLDRFDGKLKDCTRIFIPLHDGIIAHWYLLVLHPVYKQAELLDSYPTDESTNRRLENARKALKHLDYVLMEDLLDHVNGLSEFEHYTFITPKSNPRQPNNYDCGVYVIRHMQHYGCNWARGFQSADHRLRLTLELVKHGKNEIHSEVIAQCDRTGNMNAKVTHDGTPNVTENPWKVRYHHRRR